eukprot:scaffold1.g5797.t1
MDSEGAPSLLSLPPPCLSQVLKHLDLKLVLQLACVCCQLRDYLGDDAGAALYQDVELDVAAAPRLASFAAWAAPRAAGLRRLRLALPGECGGDGAPVLPLSCTQLLPRLHGLISLELSSAVAGIDLGAWAAPLRRLRQLQLTAPRLVLTEVGSQLSSLTCLSLSGLPAGPAAPGLLPQGGGPGGGGASVLVASEHCLPAGLLMLRLTDLEVAQLPPALAACARLQLLVLCGVRRAVSGALRAALDFSVLSRLTTLTALALEDVGLRAGQLPPPLPLLPRLARLAVQTGIEATQEEPFARLALCSSALQCLDLSDCMLAVFPGALLQLTQLRALSIVGNPFHRDLPLGLTALTALERLALSERQGLEWPGLPALPTLTAVWIAAGDKQQQPGAGHHPFFGQQPRPAFGQQQGPTGRQLRRLLRERLLPLPQLRDLYCSCWPLRVMLEEWRHGPEGAWVERVWRAPDQEDPFWDGWREPPRWRDVEQGPPGGGPAE